MAVITIFSSEEEFRGAHHAAAIFLSTPGFTVGFTALSKVRSLEHLHSGRDVLMDIDVQGAELVRKHADPKLLPHHWWTFSSCWRVVTRRSLDCADGRPKPRRSSICGCDNSLEEMRHWRGYQYAIVSGTPAAGPGKVSRHHQPPSAAGSAAFSTNPNPVPTRNATPTAAAGSQPEVAID